MELGTPQTPAGDPAPFKSAPVEGTSALSPAVSPGDGESLATLLQPTFAQPYLALTIILQFLASFLKKERYSYIQNPERTCDYAQGNAIRPVYDISLSTRGLCRETER